MTLTRQEIFNKAYLGLHGQGWERSNRGAWGMYRGPKGRKCAIGHCIPDELYRVEFEDSTPHDVFSAIDVLFCADDFKFLTCLQEAHDRCHVERSMKGSFDDLAKEYDLTIPQVGP